MKNITKQLVLVFLLAVWTLIPMHLTAQISDQNRIEDNTETLNSHEILNLTSVIKEVEQDEGLKVAVHMVNSIDSESEADYGSKVLKGWQSSDGKGKAVILVAKSDRKVWIAMDASVEAKFSEEDKINVVENIIVPEFRSGRFAIGIELGVEALESVVSGEELVKSTTFQLKNYPLISILTVLVLLSFLSGYIKDVKVKIGIAAIVAVLFFFVFGSIIYSILVLILSLFPLLGRSARGGGGAYGAGYADGTEGAGGIAGDSSFSLGGGAFGGGGASGDWRTFSFDTHEKFEFTDEQKSNVEQAVKDLELESSGEIVVYFARKSDSYYQGTWKLTAILGMLGAVTMLCLSYVWMLPPTFSIMNIAMSIILIMIAGLGISYFFPTVRLAFVPLNVMDHRVVTKSRDIFLQEEIFNTIERTGILIYISELEKRVQIIGDKGISSVIVQEDWNKVLGLVTDGIKQGSPSEGLVAAIHECKNLLLDNGFIVREDDTNELSDEMIIEQ
ncbi:MAG: TPM domain-containing protein [Cyclobacteriaceae bacterium]